MKMYPRILCILLALCLLAGCGAAPAQSAESAAELVEKAAPETVLTDALGRSVTLTSFDRVVSLYGSFGETWLLAGGTLVGTTSDAVEERNLNLGEEVAVIGGVKQPDTEAILALNPDFVILSADIEAQVALDDALTEMGLPHAYFRVDSLEDYLQMLGTFCAMTGRDDLYETNGAAVKQQVEETLAAVAGQEAPTVLLIRAYSTGAKAKGEDNLTGLILRDLGADNLVARYESLLEDISMEELIAADPDYIFVTSMGDDEKAKAYMTDTLETNPAWSGLSAVQSGRYVFLPKELFHYKPNARWGESYRYLAEILYPECFQ